MAASCVLAANAVPGLGGQGRHLEDAIRALRGHFALSAFVRGRATTSPAGDPVPIAVVPRSRLARGIEAVPWLRRRRDWTVLADDAHFDGYTAARLPRTTLFHGASGQSLHSLRRAHAVGARTVVDSLTVHVEDLDAAFRSACAEFGVRSPLHPRQRERVLREYDEADLIRTMSQRARATFLEKGVPADRVVVTMPPFDIAAFPVARFDHDRFRVCFVGALEPWKGFHHLLAAFSSLAERDAELVLYGGSGSRPVAQYLAQHTGPATRSHVRPMSGYEEVYGSASVLVHPSLTEGFGLVVGEAMASGLPVVVSDRTGAADLVEDGRNGYVVAAGDVGAIRERLAHLAQHPALVREMGAAARETMRAYTPERFRAELVACLSTVLA